VQNAHLPFRTWGTMLGVPKTLARSFCTLLVRET
jgi:hypothetical protein